MNTPFSFAITRTYTTTTSSTPIWTLWRQPGPGVAAGLSLRHDHGSQYLSDHFQGELRFLGIRSSQSFVAAPEGNGCAERFIRTLKEQLLWVEPFETVQQLRLALLAFKDRYNQKWLIERHGHRTPAAVRQALSPSTGAAA